LLIVHDPAGAFECRLTAAGDYSVDVEREGFFTLKRRAVQLAPGLNEIQFVLNPLREVFESVDVNASAATVDLDRAAPEKSLHGTDILAIPYPTTNNLKNALRILPGVIQDSRGGIHINGGTEEQTLYTLDGFTVNDPLTGRLESRVSVEAVQSVEVLSGAFAAEYGKGSSGVLAISTQSGTDKWRYWARTSFPESNIIRESSSAIDPRVGARSVADRRATARPCNMRTAY
jgi:outer membrane receptor protein involved in Fe transport